MRDTSKIDPMFLENGLLASPGMIEIEYSGPNVESDIIRVLTAFQLHCPFGTEKRDPSGVPQSYSISCDVENGHEWFWIEVLTRFEVIKKVSRVAARFGSASGIARPQYRSPSPTASIDAKFIDAEALKRVVDYLNDIFRGKGTVHKVSENPPLVVVKITGLRGEVIKGQKYWEELKIHAAVLSDRNILFVIDGSYASGLSESSPPAASFKDMDQQFYRELTDYVSQLITALAERFRPS